MDDILAPRCGCPDCQAAVSPGAYLADLLDYALKHVKNDGANIDVAFLEQRFQQPFADLPMECSAIEKNVRQVRLCVEVLRKYLGPRPLFDSVREQTLLDTEAEYRLAAYAQLLNEIGASYEDIRRARSADDNDRTELSQRLGIDLTPPGPGVPRQDELDQLLLDPALPSSDDRALTERAIERLFGFSDTERDCLSQGVKYGDDQQQLKHWLFDGVWFEWNTDATDLIYLSIYKLAADAYAVYVYSDSARNNLVAAGERKTSAGPIRLVAENGSGLGGVVDIDYKADVTNISVSVVPLVLGWRLRHLRSEWEREDWPANPPPDTAAPLRPLIDPQVIGLSDLRRARSGNIAFDLWLSRSKWLDNQRATIKSTREAAATPRAGLDAIINQALSTPEKTVTLATLQELDDSQRSGKRIEQSLVEVGLTSGAFNFLMPIITLAQAGQPIIDIEWETVYDTLLYARKTHEFGAWRTDEKSKTLTLSPDFFQLSDAVNAPRQATDHIVPFWLSTRDARRDWLDALEARIAQEATVAAAINNAVSAVEEAALPLLRDALLVASDAEGDSVEQKAEWLTQRLLIDFRMSGSQSTTRVAQAIETLQELLFSLRTGQLEQDVVPPFAPLVSICAVAQGERRIDLFGRGDDDVLWQRIWDGRWRSWRSRGPLPGGGASFGPSDPAVVFWGNGSLDLIVRSGGDRQLWHRRYAQQTWLDWERVEGDLELVGNPAVALTSPGQAQVVALRIGDLQVMRRRYDATNWTAWEAIGVTSSRSPTVASPSPDRLDLFLGRPAPDLFKPQHRWWDGAAWQDEFLDDVLSSDPAAAAPDANALALFQNRFGHLWQKTFNGAWNAWIDLDAGVGAGPTLQGVPAIYSRAPGTLDVFALRSGSVCHRSFVANAWSNWENLPSGELTLVAQDFDTEWKWIGSYATWRAATFVRLYPENLLLPSLITHQTPAFQTLVAQTRPTQRLAPEQTCEIARKYSDYLRDVSSLEIQASCRVLTYINRNEPCKTAAPVGKNLFYMFGRTTWGKVYWSAIDPADRSGYAQSSWSEVLLTPKTGTAAPEKVLKIIGALPWLNANFGQHHIYLFVMVDEPSGSKLKRIRFDLDRYGRDDAWDADIVELSDVPTYMDPNTKTVKPNRVGSMTILPVQSDTVTEAPRLAVHAHMTTMEAFIRPLNLAGDGYEGTAGDWAKYEIVPRSGPFISPETVEGLHAALRVNNVNWLVYGHGTTRRVYAAVPGQNGTDIGDRSAKLRGALPGGSTDSSIFIFYDADDQTVYREVKKNAGAGSMVPGLGTEFIPTPSLRSIPPHSGSSPASFVMLSSGGYSFAYGCQAQSGQLIGSGKVQVTPMLSPVYDVPSGGSIYSLQGRRVSIKNVYDSNKGASASILTYLAEAYRLVPLQLGLNMQASREYVAALDWFSTVYDYRAPLRERYIDYGLEIDAELPTSSVFRHPEDWLLDPLNPHAVALTRRYAYTRFVMCSIIHCVNDFADAEFTTDTDESLVRARLLYTTALELCNVPELRQQLNACDALIAELRIQPGETVPPEVAAALGEIADDLTQGKVSSAPGGLFTLDKMKKLIQSGKSWETIIPELKALKKTALQSVPVPMSAPFVAAERAAVLEKAYSQLLTDPAIETTLQAASAIAIGEAAASLAGLQS